MNLRQNNPSQTSSTKKSGLMLQQLTPQEKTNLKKQYIIWTQQAIKQMQKNATNNVTQRIPIMLDVANDKTKLYQTSQLTITEKEENCIVNKVHSEIATWNGIQIGTCKTEKNQFVDYSHTARNWFNRNKSKIYGNHVFYPIIFVKIYQFTLNLQHITANQKIVLFVDILHAILHSTVQFKRSKAHPLIPHQTFIQENLFTKACITLCQYYKVKCDLCLMQQKRQQLPNGQYAKNRERSKDINKAFICKIEEIKENILYKNINKSLPNFNNLSNSDHDDHKCNQNKLNENPAQNVTIRKYKVPKFNKNNINCNTMSDHQYQTSTLRHRQNISRNNADNILINAVDKSLINLQRLKQSNKLNVIPTIQTTPYNNNTQITPINYNNNNNTINNFNIISPPIMTMPQPIQSPLNYFNYSPNRGQNNMVSQSRHSPILSSPYVNIAVNPNMDGAVTVSLHNINQQQTMQFISLLYGSKLQ